MTIQPDRERSRDLKILLFASLAFALLPALGLYSRDSSSDAIFRSENPEAREERNNSAAAIILGEFRTNLSDFIFIKTERYLDNGIAYAPHLDTKAMSQSGAIQQKKPAGHNHDHDHDHDHEEGDDHETTVPTLIKTMAEDYRGFIGNLEREVKPWRDPSLPHQHTSGVELLPWYRLATLSNPNNVRMYLIGSWWLKTMHTEAQTSEALKFVQEGIKFNPKSWQLHLMEGYIKRQLLGNLAALPSFQKAADIAEKVRPAGGTIGPSWDLNDEEQASAACVMVTLILRDEKGPAAALPVGERYLKLFPESPLIKIVKQLRETAPAK